MTVGNWRFRIVSATPNAVDQVLAENDFNSAPDPDQQDFLVSVSAT